MNSNFDINIDFASGVAKGREAPSKYLSRPFARERKWYQNRNIPFLVGSSRI